MTKPASPGDSAVPRRFGPRPGTVIVIAIIAFFVLVGGASAGFPGMLMMAGLVGLGTALYSLVTGRKSWARIPSRGIAAAALVVALVTTSIGASAYDAPADLAGSETDVTTSAAVESAPTPTPTKKPEPPAAFTAEAPVDPDVTTASGDRASVAVADRTVPSTTARALLATLPVKGRAPKTGYARTAQFGSAWLDVDRNGCDTRNDVLTRDLTRIVRSGPCKVLSGHLDGPYTGKSISFVRGVTTSMLVQIDHVVALSNAWQTGAQLLTPTQRISLANDPLNLLAVDGRTNAQKGDGDAATWLPPVKSYRCQYVARQISVKATYGLWVVPAELAAMTRILASCPDQPAMTSGFAPKPKPVAKPVPTVAPAPVVVVPVPVPVPAPTAVHPGAFCAPAGAAGVTTIGTPMICGTTPNSPDRARWHKR